MSGLALERHVRRACVGLKGPRAEPWLAAQGLTLPRAPNTWTHSSGAGAAAELLVARLGAAEFFVDAAAGAGVAAGAAALRAALAVPAPGVYPVLREDALFELGGAGVHEVLAQVCNVHFEALALDSRPVIMTLMIGVAVLVVPQAADGERRYRIWCDPTFAPSWGENLEAVVVDCGGTIRGDPA
jgi:sarcosine oxidase subunit gamma